MRVNTYNFGASGSNLKKRFHASWSQISPERIDITKIGKAIRYDTIR